MKNLNSLRGGAARGKSLLGIGLVFMLGLSSTAWCGKIVRPWRATTEIVKAGESFEAWYNADTGQTVNSVELQGPYSTVVPTMATPVTGSWVYDHESGNTYNRKITITVPLGSPADRYDLVLKTSSGNEISVAAVKVIKEYKSNYYIVHMSDAHRWQKESMYPVETTLRKVSAVIDVANIIGAEMLFETGDHHYPNTLKPDSTAERTAIMFAGIPGSGINGLHDASAASFIVPGNHDTNKHDYTQEPSLAVALNWYNQQYGLAYYNFKYGNGRFMGVNSGMGPVPAAQTSAAAAWLRSVGQGNFRMGAAHAGVSAVASFEQQTGLNLILVGHNHFIANSNPHAVNGKLIQYVANSLRDLGTGNFECNIFRVNNNTGLYEVLGSTQSRVHLIENHTKENINNPSSWVPMLQLSYGQTNNGTSTENKAVIINKYDFPLPEARVRFVMPLGAEYAVSPGTIQQAFDGDAVHIVDVSVDLEANSTTAISIYLSGSVTNSSQFVSQSVPTVVDTGLTYPVSITVTNTGLDAWTTASGHSLGSYNPPGNTNWGLSQIPLPHAVATNEAVTFTFNVTAPTERGIYDFQWRMMDDIAPNEGWFGQITPNEVITVGAQDLHIEAEDFDVNSGFQTESTTDIGGGLHTAYATAGDYMTYDIKVTHPGVYKAIFRYSSATAGAKLDLKNGSTVLCSVNEPATGDFQIWQTSTPYLVTLPEGSLTLTIFATGPSWNMNWFELIALDDPPGNVSPVINSSPDTTVVENESYSYSMYATDADPDTLTYAAPITPDWLSFNSGIRVLSGTPLFEDIGTDAVSLTVYDGTVTVTQSFNIVVSAEPVAPRLEVILAVDLHQLATDLVPVTPDYFTGWFVGNVSAGVAAPSTNINGYAITLGSGTSIGCLVNPALQAGMNARNRTTGYILNAGEFTQADMMRERIASLGSPTTPTTGKGTGSGLYLKVSGLSANTSYMIQAWGVDSTGLFASSNVRLKDGYNYGYDATAETGGYTSLPQVETYTVAGSPTTIADNDQYSVSGIITTDSSGTLIYKQISNIDKSVMNGFVLSTVDYAPPNETVSVSLSPTNQTYNGTARIVTATTTPAGKAVEITYDGSATAPTHAGSYTIIGTVNEAMYQGGTTGTLTVAKANQTIDFPTIGNQITTNEVALSATASSGLSVANFSVVSGPAVVNGSSVSFTSCGQVVLSASQAGDSNWNAAPATTITFDVTKATASVSLGNTSQTYNGTARIITATTTPVGMAVEITYDGSATAPTQAGIYTIIGAVNETMYQGSVTGTLTVAKADQTINFPVIGQQEVTSTFNLVASSTSTFPVSFSTYMGNPATIAGTRVSFGRAGEALVLADQSGDGNWNAAPTVTNLFDVIGVITNVSPDNGTVFGGTEVVIDGAWLGDGNDITNVTLCGITATVVSQSLHSVTVETGVAPPVETISDTYSYVGILPPGSPFDGSSGDPNFLLQDTPTRVTTNAPVEFTGDVIVSSGFGTVVLTNAFTYRPVPLAPTAISAVDITDSQFTARWVNEDDTTTHYYLDVSESTNFTAFTGSYSNWNVGNATAGLVTGLVDGVTYWYRVRAANPYGPSLDSNRIETPVSTNTPYSDYELTNTVVSAGSGDVVDLEKFFSGSGMSYEVVANSNSNLVTATIVGSELMLDYATGGSGSASITIRVTDIASGFWVENTITVSVEIAPGLTRGTITVNPQNGLFEEVVTVVNNSLTFAARAITLTVTNLSAGAELYNATGTDPDGHSEILWIGTLGAGASMDFTLQYYTAHRGTVPTADVFASLSMEEPGETVTGSHFALSGEYRNINSSSFLIEFVATPGNTYYIQYTDDLSNPWKTVQPGIVAPANRVQWIDSGPPGTECAPGAAGNRFYRIIEAD